MPATLALLALLAGPPAPRAFDFAPETPPRLRCLVEAYPEQLCGADADTLRWCDGSTMPWRARTTPTADHRARLDTANLSDQMAQRYPVGRAYPVPPPDHDPGRLRYEPFFRKMYGATRAAVAERTETVDWLDPPGKAVRMTRVNDVAARLSAVRAEVAALPAPIRSIVRVPAGGFVWRTIKGTERLSMHSFGVAVDVGVEHSDYWRWAKPGPDGRRRYRNRIPLEVVEVFERHGFVWGGKWHHFDTMHFEYRPELFCPD